jgi:hypothetical protein
MLVLCINGLKKICDTGLSLIGAGNGHIGLFTNNHAPVEADVIGNYVEPTAGWYARQALGNWPASSYVLPNATSVNAPITWTDTGGIGSNATVYGYFIVDAGGVLMWAELDPAGPFTLSAAGYTYTVTPTFDTENQ